MKIEIGDKLTFRSVTRSDNRKATRKVNGFYCGSDMPTVQYHGWSHFVVKGYEILKVNGEDYVRD